SAHDRIAATSARGWRRVDGKPFADQVGSLIDPLGGNPLFFHPLLLHESGGAAGGFRALTNSRIDGMPASTDCTGFTSGSGSVIYGTPAFEDAAWSDDSTAPCSDPFHLYCLGVSLNN